ncbi:MAG TPA: TIR domain-containing protein [Rhizomicrobium sp.]|nr:TIR domain-containing protein [Rhizomicrobium sp.]
MAGEIFISYRRADEAWARHLHDRLKAEGVEAWYDGLVGPGQEWRTATARALEASQIFVLLFSENAAQSSDIVKELAAATHEKKLIVPVRLQNIEPKGAFLYELASRNWVNAYDDTRARLTELAKGLAHLVRTGARDESVLPFEHSNNRRQTQAPWGKLTRKPAIIAAALVVAATLAFLFWIYPRHAAVVANSSSSPGPAGISVAVLPFLNLSSDKDQEFFSDGITEEITSALAKVPGLTVIGRTSAFQFKGENKDMRAIGEALGAKNLIEGSVRKAGNEVRITAQLIKAADGTHLWTESYDRKLTDIFAVQEDIATAIAGALQVPLGLKLGQNLVSNRTADTNSYQDYLRAKALFRARKLNDVIAVLRSVVVRDPNYAPAWALLAEAYIWTTQFNAVDVAVRAGSTDDARRLVQSQYELAEKAAREAIRLDPGNAVAYEALGNLEQHRGNFIAAEDNNRRALALDPNDPEVLYDRGYLLGAMGRIKEALRVQTQILALEPFVPAYRNRAADLLWAMGRNDAAIKIWEAMARGGLGRLGLAKGYATAGRYSDAADTLLAVTPQLPDDRQSLEEAARLLRTAPAKVGAPNALPLLPQDLSFVYLFIGAEDRSLEVVEREIAVGYYGAMFRNPWSPPSAALRKTERFKTFARKAGLVEYWKVRGWPDVCHPVGADDFACN